MSSVSKDSSTKTADSPVLSNFRVRYLTAVVLLPLVLLTVYLGGIAWIVLITVIAVVGGLEFFMFASGKPIQGSALIGIPMILVTVLGFALDQPIIWIVGLVVGTLMTLILEMARHPANFRRTLWQVGITLAGVVYIGFPSGFLIDIRTRESGLAWMLVIFATTWGTDTFAYFGGRLFGKTKLAPKLSPNKTVEGAVAGIFGGFLIALMFLVGSDLVSRRNILILAIAPLVAIAGDLLESAIKRYFQVKDSHIAGLNIVPGHGGVLDRVDALLMVTSFFYLIFVLVPGS